MSAMPFNKGDSVSVDGKAGVVMTTRWCIDQWQVYVLTDLLPPRQDGKVSGRRVLLCPAKDVSREEVAV